MCCALIMMLSHLLSDNEIIPIVSLNTITQQPTETCKLILYSPVPCCFFLLLLQLKKATFVLSCFRKSKNKRHLDFSFFLENK